MIYLDNAATSYPKPREVLDAMMQTMAEKGANPGRGGYAMALESSRVIFSARELISRFVFAETPEEVVFTSNATEAINLAIFGLLVPGDHVISTSMEHNSVYRPLMLLEKLGVSTTFVGADSKGVVSAEDIAKAINKHTKLIIVSHASNVCGTIMPVAEIGKVAREHGVYFAVDAAQSIGLIPINVQEMNIDLLAFPGHKGLYGPFGTGGLYIRSGILLKPLKYGGTGVSSTNEEMPNSAPERYEAGSLNVPGIAGLAAGVEYVNKLTIPEIMKKGCCLTALLMDGLEGLKGIKIYGTEAARRVPVVSFNIDGIDGSEAALLLDKKYNIAVRAGLHCAPLAHKTLGTIDTGTIRVSFGTFNNEEDVYALINAVKEIKEM